MTLRIDASFYGIWSGHVLKWNFNPFGNMSFSELFRQVSPSVVNTSLHQPLRVVPNHAVPRFFQLVPSLRSPSNKACLRWTETAVAWAPRLRRKMDWSTSRQPSKHLAKGIMTVTGDGDTVTRWHFHLSYLSAGYFIQDSTELHSCQAQILGMSWQKRVPVSIFRSCCLALLFRFHSLFHPSQATQLHVPLHSLRSLPGGISRSPELAASRRLLKAWNLSLVSRIQPTLAKHIYSSCSSDKTLRLWIRVKMAEHHRKWMQSVYQNQAPFCIKAAKAWRLAASTQRQDQETFAAFAQPLIHSKIHKIHCY